MNQHDYWTGASWRDNFRREIYHDYGWIRREIDEPLTPLGDEWWIYGGTVTAILNLSPYYSFPLSELGDYLWFWDLPLSLAGDTILLPMTIVQQIVGRPGKQDEETDPTDEERQRQHDPSEREGTQTQE